MKEIYEFMINALPWIAMGLLVATSCVMGKAKSEKTEVSGILKGLCWSPSVCFLFVAIMEFCGGNQSRGTVWLVLGVFNAVLNFANTYKDDK